MQLTKKILKILPESFQLYVIRNYLRSKEKTLHEKELPDAITFFVTSRCNARCEHCFYWKELNADRDELTLEEINKVATSMSKGLDSLALTGGEPTLPEGFRGNLQDILMRDVRHEVLVLQVMDFFQSVLVIPVSGF